MAPMALTAQMEQMAFRLQDLQFICGRLHCLLAQLELQLIHGQLVVILRLLAGVHPLQVHQVQGLHFGRLRSILLIRLRLPPPQSIGACLASLLRVMRGLMALRVLQVLQAHQVELALLAIKVHLLESATPKQL